MSYIELIKWQNIIDYSWSEEKPHLLEIKYQNASKRKLKLKILVATDEKNTVETILKNKIS